MKKKFSVFFAILMLTSCIFSCIPANAQELVVVIDPGHNSEGSGANCVYQNQPYHEAVFNLKIAKAAKKYLEEYKSVVVYLTRDNYSTDLENSDRVSFASQVGANFLLSIHCNDSGSPSTSGAIAIASWSHAFEAEKAQVTRDIGAKILSKFEAVGIENKGLYLKRATELDPNYKVFYPDGTEQDYYGMTQRALRIGIPCTLVECGFISNEHDLKILANDAKLDELGKACADSIAEYYGLQKDSEISSPETHPIYGASLDFSLPYICDLIYPLTGDGVKYNGSYAEMTGGDTDRVKAFIDYMGMSIRCADFKSVTINMCAGSTSKLDIYVGANKQWTHEQVEADGNKFSVQLTDSFRDYTFDLTSLPVWKLSVNMLEFYLTGSDFLKIKSITFNPSEGGLIPSSSTATPKPTETEKPTEKPTVKPTETQTAKPTETPGATNTSPSGSTGTPSEKIIETSAPLETSESGETGNGNNKGKNNWYIYLLLALCLIAMAAILIGSLKKGRKK